MIFQSILGILSFILIAWLISENRRRFPYKAVIGGLLLQFGLALILLKIPVIKDGFVFINRLVMVIEKSTVAGTSFVFGFLGGGELPYQESFPSASFILAFRSLPIILVMSALSAVLFYLKVLPFIVRIFSWILEKGMGISGAAGLAAAANIFVGMIEAPLLIKPYLVRLSRSDLFLLMAAGMATIGGTVMVLYASILAPVIEDPLSQILIASILSAPAAVLIALVMVPGDGKRIKPVKADIQSHARGVMDAVTRGTRDGIQLYINIVAMLIVLVALVSLINQILSILPNINGNPITLEGILSYIMAPLVWLMGIPWDEAMTAGSLMGIKTILNEFLAYIQLSKIPNELLSPKSKLIMTYALCGFANIGSLGILIGGMTAMVPERKREIIGFGFRSVIAGTLASMMTGAVIAIVG